MPIIAKEIRIEGVVQGVGFRPFVYRLALKHEIKGWVLNSSEGLTIWAEGDENKVADFYREIRNQPPKLAIIVKDEQISREVEGYNNFFIKHSEAKGRKDVLISPDVCTCEDCFQEITDPHNRRYRYPFTNCTNCGPRFTIIMDVPYDRENTTMRDFPMCSECAEEFEDPLNRRFHAQPNACPQCGPQVTLRNQQGDLFPGLGHEFLKAGKIMAVKGLGGFHLVCNALDREAVRSLRKRKIREFKPFAVMCRDLEVVKRFCEVSLAEIELLTSPAHPIVILKRRCFDSLPEELAPGMKTLGVMLPYTPLHYLLFAEDLEIFVMTSANISDDPLIIDNDEALIKLKGIADYYLLHNREIYNRCDDSLAAVVEGEAQIYRRARGYVPLPVNLPEKVPSILGCGGELKGCFCLTKGNGAYLSQHLGDLNHYGNYRQFLYTIPRFEKMLAVKPEIIAYDLHPDYMASRWALGREGAVKIGIQHHHAHMAGCLAENGVREPSLGVVCDGTGYGLDGAIWGFEFFAGRPADLKRLAHLAYLPLPGEVTVKKPARMAFVYLYKLFGRQGLVLAEKYLPTLLAEERQVLIRQLEGSINTIPTSSCGRLFDAVSAFLGICSAVRYEAQAAMELETIADPDVQEAYRYELDTGATPYKVGVKGIWEGMIRELEKGIPVSEISGRFHYTVASLISRVLVRLREDTGLNQVALSGGVFQNRLLFHLLRRLLATEGFKVFYHRRVPSNDGGIALGQIYIASEVMKNVSCHTGQGCQS